MKLKEGFICLLILAIAFTGYSQSNSSYHPSVEKVFDLIHTKANLSIDMPNSKLSGEVWLTLKSHFYETDQLVLDAKNLEIEKILINGYYINYNYDDKLEIELPKKYKQGEELTVFIKYSASSNNYNEDGTVPRGLFFINPEGKIPNKPTQVWTNGQSKDATNSMWIPTLDSPNQKTTQEINLTVPQKYKTLSNGSLVKQVDNNNGTRTDYWKQDLKHAPYLMFFTIGEYEVINKDWKGKTIQYFVEPKDKEIAEKVFEKTIDILNFYEEKFDLPYVWDKYAQVVVRDYIGGSMENTTATLHNYNIIQPVGSLVDQNEWESTIAHEIAHHWFGNLVTAESWGNLSLNESFATYAEYLWFEYAYGKDYADFYLQELMDNYYEGNNESKDLVRFNYEDREDLFDHVSYDKGAVILHMLRQEIGDKAFFEGMHLFLNKFKFQTAEIHDLRICFEEVTGKDLNQYFNEFFLNSGHQKLHISQEKGGFNERITLTVSQGVKKFNYPLSVSIYYGKNNVQKEVLEITKQSERFDIKTKAEPKTIVFNEGVGNLVEISQQLTVKDYKYQYLYSNSAIIRYKALEAIVKLQSTNEMYSIVELALNDDFYQNQILALSQIDLSYKHSKLSAIQKIEKLAKQSTNTLVQAEALRTLGKLVAPKYKSYFEKGLQSDSYAVVESSAIGLYQLENINSLKDIDSLPEVVKDHLSDLLIGFYLDSREDKYLTYLSKHVSKGLFFKYPDSKLNKTYKDAFTWVARSNNYEAIQNLTESIVVLGMEYKDRKADKLAVSILKEMVVMQKNTSNPNKEELILMIRKAIALLLV